MSKYGEVYRISVSAKKGSKKSNIDKATLIENFGIEGDAHAGWLTELIKPTLIFNVLAE